MKDWKGYDKTTDDADNSNNTAVDKVTLVASDDNKEIIKEWSRPSEIEREEIHKEKGRPELISEDAENKKTIKFGVTTRLKIEVEKEIMGTKGRLLRVEGRGPNTQTTPIPTINSLRIKGGPTKQKKRRSPTNNNPPN